MLRIIMTPYKFHTFLLALVILLLATVLLHNSVSAFKPNESGHLGITKDALSDSQVMRSIDGEELKFTDKAIKEVQKANKETDSLTGDFWDDVKHFDNEKLSQASQRLITLREEIITILTTENPDGANARKKLGTALHTLQDFYAHSNWVELKKGPFLDLLGRSLVPSPALSVKFCPNRQDKLEGPGLTDITTGWFDIGYTHGLCYSPVGKCNHGVEFIPFCSGIAKDDTGNPLHASAYNSAKAASIDYVNQILNATGIANNAKAIKALMRIKGTLAMVIDDTGSMQPVIDSVKAQVASIVNAVDGTEDEPSEYLLVRFGDPDVGEAFKTDDAQQFLTRVNSLFADGGGDCPELSQTGLLRAVDASRSDSSIYLFTDALAKDANLAGNVIASAQKKRIRISPILSGNCAEEVGLQASQLGKQQSRRQIRTVSNVDPSYIRAAEETGGQVVLQDLSQPDSVFDLIRPQLSGDLTTILSSSGVISSAKEITIPVDSTISDLVISILFESEPLVTESDVDYYQFTANAGDQITASIESDIFDEFDSLLTLYNADGGSILAENDNFGENRDSLLEYQLTQAGSYLLGVRGTLSLANYSGFSGAVEPYYYLSVTTPITPILRYIDETEPNHTPQTATSILIGDQIIANLSFNVLSITPGYTLTRPSGTAVLPTDANTQISDSNVGRTYTTRTTETGIWKLKLSGKGKYTVVAKANSLLDFYNSEFVELITARHTGLYAIAGQPLIGKQTTNLSTIIGTVSNTQFKLLNQSGELLQPIDLKQNNPEAAADEFVGLFDLPDTPFRIAATGLDQQGKLFERLYL